MTDIFSYLENNAYPGRGLLVGCHDGQTVIAYFIMGRSVNSRNRIFVRKDGILFTKAYDESAVADPSLIIYNVLREHEGRIIVTNGDQTDTIYEYLEKGKTFREALDTREYEPDVPNCTPRISAIINPDNTYDIAILKRKEDECQRLYYHYDFHENCGHFISTYDHDGDPLPSFSSEPLAVSIDDGMESFAEKLWSSLNEDNKISLYVRFGNQELIYNKNEVQ